ncbi:hypothetical protein T484DRAFT_1989504 [Baffinella frigidus]|nr:hypothetical protein T484DRAFT_1989504 [Cryptophyta sp. CCMP2293]
MSMGERRRQLREQGGAARQKGASPTYDSASGRRYGSGSLGEPRSRGAVHCRFMRRGGLHGAGVSCTGEGLTIQTPTHNAGDALPRG